MVFREHYIQELETYIDKPIIKVLTGIRRSGKSTILSMIKERLLQKGVNTEQIISLNFESFQVAHLLNARHYTTIYVKNHKPGKVLLATGRNSGSSGMGKSH